MVQGPLPVACRACGRKFKSWVYQNDATRCASCRSKAKREAERKREIRALLNFLEGGRGRD